MSSSETGASIGGDAFPGSELRAHLEQARKENVAIWDLVQDQLQMSDDVLADAFSAWLRIPRVRIASATVDPDATKAVNEELARKHNCLPLSIEKKSLVLAMANPADYDAVQLLQFATGLQIRPVVASHTEILDGIQQYYSPESGLQDFLANVADAADLHMAPQVQEKEMTLDASGERGQADLPPVVKMCNVMVQDAVKQGASDVHIEPALHTVQVRMRIDGMLRDYMQIPKWLHNAVVSRLKILARLDIAERRVPQDGRIKVQYEKRSMDLRVSTLPTHFGEKVVMRVLGSSDIPGLEKLGFSPPQRSTIDAALNQPQGMILVTGPTGSGKSTALYSMINQRKTPEVNIVTVEDPIEYQLAGINQVQVNIKTGLTFAACLRSILRQDPDVILIGEIRDLETAEIAFHAAMTGHLVLSTLHTNSSLATIARLLDMGVDPYLVATSVTVIMAQRLARRICKQCREQYQPPSQILEKFRLEESGGAYYRGSGCHYCGGTGYSGRIGIYEMLRITPSLKRLIQAKAPENELRKVAGVAGTRFLLEDAIDKVRAGITTLDEVLRVIQLQESEIIRCPQCQAFINLEFATCPYCLHALKQVCGSCGQELKLEWKICPYCNTRTDFAEQAASVQGLPSVAEERPAPAAPPRQAYAPPAVAAPPAAPPRVAAPPVAVPPPITAPPVAPPPAYAEPQPYVPGAPPMAAQPSTPLVTLKAPSGEAEAEPAKTNTRVLIVDDDDGIKKIIRKTLEQIPVSLDIDEASDGVEALERIETRPPDLVITDIMMPRMDGFTLCERLRKDIRTTFVPIIMLTASADEASRTRGYMTGTDDFVAKPFNIPEFTARVMRLLRRTYGL